MQDYYIEIDGLRMLVEEGFYCRFYTPIDDISLADADIEEFLSEQDRSNLSEQPILFLPENAFRARVGASFKEFDDITKAVIWMRQNALK